jgi:MTH538 TIR-like domain (DUF1863)
MSYPYQARTFLDALAGITTAPVRRRIFISYHHQHDQAYYDALSKTLHDKMDLVYDNSLDRKIDSENTDYVIQRIRDDFISNTSCAIVLCGPETYQRKYVDWEIKAALDKEHGLIGLQLPTAVSGDQGGILVPSRLHQNIVSGYALWKSWSDFAANPALMTSWIEDAVNRDKSKIVNPQAIKSRNG